MLAMDGLQKLGRIVQFSGSRRDALELVVPVYRPGTTGPRPVVSVTDIQPGTDWNKNRVFVTTTEKLSALSEPQIQAITENARLGQSWQAMQREQKLREKIRLLENQIAALTQAQAPVE